MECGRCRKIFYRNILGNYSINCKEHKRVDFLNRVNTYEETRYKLEMCQNCSIQFDKFMRGEK